MEKPKKRWNKVQKHALIHTCHLTFSIWNVLGNLFYLWWEYNLPFSVTSLQQALQKCKDSALVLDNIPYLQMTHLPLVLKLIFQLSIDSDRIPAIWKLSPIVPAPKATRSNELNDCRPVAFTSPIMKTLEKNCKEWGDCCWSTSSPATVCL